MHRLRDVCKHLPNRCLSPRSKIRKSGNKVSGRLSDLSFMSNVLSGRCNHHFTGEVDTSSCFMGVIMENTIKKYNIIAAIMAIVIFPILFWALGDAPKRTWLKEAISILTILAYFMMLGQFFLARSNHFMLKAHKMNRVLKLHKFIGYLFVLILLIHPLLIVFPRYFEAGVDPVEAFITILSTYDSIGVLFGIIAWCLMLILGITSLFRNKIGLSYKNWKIFHGLLSIAFIIFASWHAIDLGRHTNIWMSVYMIIIGGIGIILLLSTYFSKSLKEGETND